jgi:hypothetical protein
MDTANISKFSMMIDVLVGAPARYREILEPLLQGPDTRIEGVALQDAARAVFDAFSRREDWATLSEADRLEEISNVVDGLRDSNREPDRLASGILAWALANRRRDLFPAQPTRHPGDRPPPRWSDLLTLKMRCL